ncbi:acyl carrier protein [Companilactobacillus allii]|uniref:Acyl carrier protein n=1 Tax=Companilactobacillus allii TaxID=1847728 RepID=A0A1P8Q419_9LACO|nr:acyl carrier protein [Companilactobacillus allii]APX72596.1 acyl carrier protein [Companilactobacillus allii]USQ69700.1 acyl carrier protein [Companilactobacillus allii]
MSEQEIYDKIVALIVDKFEVEADSISKETSFTDDLDADSIDLVEFVLELEEEFDAEIPDEDAEKITTVGEAVDYIKNNQK